MSATKMMTFAELAAMDQTDIPEVKLMPVGHYQWAVVGAAEMKKSANGAGENISFKCNCIAPDEDFADPEALEEFGNPAGTKRTLMFYIPSVPKEDEDTEAFNRRVLGSVNRLKEFLFSSLQIEAANLQEALSVCNGYRFIGEIKHEPDQRNPGKFQERLSATGPIS